jgi:hypothetical protein
MKRMQWERESATLKVRAANMLYALGFRSRAEVRAALKAGFLSSNNKPLMRLARSHAQRGAVVAKPTPATLRHVAAWALGN